MSDGANRQPRPPTLLDALLPVVVLIGLIALTIALFGISPISTITGRSASRKLGGLGLRASSTPVVTR